MPTGVADHRDDGAVTAVHDRRPFVFNPFGAHRALLQQLLAINSQLLTPGADYIPALRA